MITKVNELYKTLLEKYKGGISNTSTAKFNDLKNLFKSKYNLEEDDVYATGAGNRPGNLEVRLSQGVQATKHTILCLAFLIDKKGSKENREKLTKSTFVTIRKSLGRGKSSYDNILIFIESNGELFASGLMYNDDSTIKDDLMHDFDIELTKLASSEEASENKGDASAAMQVGVNNCFDPNDLSNIILYGPPGTGKTFTMQGMVSALGDESLYMSTTFHQSLSYEDFVEGIKPEIKKSDDNSDIRYIIEKGIFYMACEKAAELAGYSSLAECISDDIYSRKEKLDKAIADKKVVLLCIDEINRGNVAAIFGELITLIEESKRLGREDETTATLPYSKKSFGVPSNLRIVGTMNTADRSIQLLDSALRRRFKFVELLPSYTVPYKNDKAITILKRINARVRCLLNKDNQSGHSYLMHAETEKDIFFAVTNKIIPLLEEYFYNDIPKVRFVLNENDDTTYPFYIEDVEAKEAYALFLNESDIDAEEKNFYVLSVNATTDEDYSHYLKHILGEPED